MIETVRTISGLYFISVEINSNKLKYIASKYAIFAFKTIFYCQKCVFFSKILKSNLKIIWYEMYDMSVSYVYDISWKIKYT